jgi:hypothetical protein
MPDFPHRRTPLKAELKAKNAELEKIRIRARTIIEEHKQGLPAEQEVAVKALLEKASELKAEIDAETKMDDYKADLAKLDAFIDDPVRKVPHGINGDASECKALERQGWEFKGGLAYAPTSLGKTYPMFGQDVLFGDIPTNDPDQARFFKTTRASMSAEYKAAYAQLIRNTAKAQNDAMAYGMLTNAEQKALSEGSDTAGGFLVPPDVQAELLVRTAQMAVMRQYARVQTTNRDVLKWPAVAANTTSGFTSIYSSGFVGGWVGETPAFSDTDPAFQTFEVPIRKLRVVTKLSNDFVADAAVNILAFLASNGAENMALVEDYGFFQCGGQHHRHDQQHHQQYRQRAKDHYRCLYAALAVRRPCPLGHAPDHRGQGARSGGCFGPAALATANRIRLCRGACGPAGLQRGQHRFHAGRWHRCQQGTALR